MASKNIIQALENLIVETPDSVPHNKIKILMVGAEAAPYAKVGGYAMVLNYLSRALASQGYEVRVFMPKFGFIDKEEKYELKTVIENLEVPTGDEGTPNLICNIKSHKDSYGVTTYFLENMEYYEQRTNVYGYSDDPVRWALLSRGALEFIRSKEFVPHVIHANDWHTGLIANYLKTEYKKDTVLDEISTLFTIHSIAHQGNIVPQYVSELDFDDGKSQIPSLFEDRLQKLNFMKRGIIYSDAVNTVSKTYSKEILTEEYGAGLDKLLLEVKSKLFGIINGIDYDEFNPATDKYIDTNYDIKSLDLRIKNKLSLQEEMDIPQGKHKFLLGFVGRLDHQKGVDLIIKTLNHALVEFEDLQFVQVGGGDNGLVEQLLDLKERFPKQVGIHPYPNFTLPRLIFAGCDAMLLPSRFEPCGIVQLEAMRYGAVPIVRKVGGLNDTVTNFDSIKKTGSGLVFSDFNEFALFGQIVRALELYKNKKLWGALQSNAMKADFSWEFSAKEYVKLYEKTIALKTNPHPKVNNAY